MKKLLSSILVAIFSLSAVFALPGFTPYINDIPGEYVWYKDYTFQRESYVGFLTFDAATYEARYFAPQNAAKKLPEKDIKIYFMLDPAADHVELKGERVISGTSYEDTEIVNYLHDMIYELNARRIKAGKVSPGEEITISDRFFDTGKVVRDEFQQFGGSVDVVYDFFVPLFNVKKIETLSGETVFSVVTTGRIQSSEDVSFDSFKGFPEKYPSKKHSFKKNKKAVPSEYTTADGQKITLDSSWVQSMENLWLLGDAALVSAGMIPGSVNQSAGGASGNGAGRGADDVASSAFILRQLLLSGGVSYTDWKNLKVENFESLYKNESSEVAGTGKPFKLNVNVWQHDTENLTRSIKVITKKEGGYAFFTFTAFENVYSKYRSYFDGIVKSYKN